MPWCGSRIPRPRGGGVRTGVRETASAPVGLAVVALAAVSCVAPALATAQIQPGRMYVGGERISDPSIGLTLTLPVGWRGMLAPGGESFVMEADSGDGYLFVTGDQMAEAEARAQLGQPIDLGDGVVLTPAGEVRQIATGHLSSAFGVQGAPTEMEGTVDVRLTRTGLGVAFILLATPGTAEGHRESMRAFALSLGVTEVVARSGQASGDDAWEPYLKGRYLARYFTGSQYTESTELWLCSDGTFHFNDQAGGYGGGASGAYQGLGDGRWSATGAGAAGTLLLEWAGGEQSSWSLEYDYEQDRLYMNGDRWLRGQNERCSE